MNIEEPDWSDDEAVRLWVENADEDEIEAVCLQTKDQKNVEAVNRHLTSEIGNLIESLRGISREGHDEVPS